VSDEGEPSLIPSSHQFFLLQPKGAHKREVWVVLLLGGQQEAPDNDIPLFPKCYCYDHNCCHVLLGGGKEEEEEDIIGMEDLVVA